MSLTCQVGKPTKIGWRQWKSIKRARVIQHPMRDVDAEATVAEGIKVEVITMLDPIISPPFSTRSHPRLLFTITPLRLQLPEQPPPLSPLLTILNLRWGVIIAGKGVISARNALDLSSHPCPSNGWAFSLNIFCILLVICSDQSQYQGRKMV